MTTVSVIIPCYNLGAYLPEAIDSVLQQTFADFEILVVDDGSTDPETIALLANPTWPKTRVFYTKNQGLAAARNYLIARASGTYLCALDADDKLDPRFFEHLLARFARDPDLSFVSCWLQAFGDESFAWQPERCDLVTLLGECTVATPALVRRDQVQAIGGYDGRASCHEDWDVWLRLVAAGRRGVIVPETLFHYRRRAGSMSQEQDGLERAMPYFVEKHRALYKQHMFEVLMRQEAELLELARKNHLLEVEIANVLEPELARRQAESGRVANESGIRQELERTKAALEQTELALIDARGELAALHASQSWRITQPLRTGYELMLRLRRGAAW